MPNDIRQNINKFKNWKYFLNENNNRKHYKFDISTENLEQELHDAQGEKQQFIYDEELKELFGDYKNPEIMLISDIAPNYMIDGYKLMIAKQGKYGKAIVDGFKKSMMANEPILPVVAWKESSNKYSLISGRHRVLASIELGLTHIPVIKMYWRDKWDD